MLKILQNDWGIRMGKYRLILESPSESEALGFIESECDRVAEGLRKWGMQECLVFFPNCPRPFRIPVAIAKKYTYQEDTKMLKGLPDQNWLRIAEEIYQNPNPCFLVDMGAMQNTLVNSAACAMMDCSAEELLSRKLSKLWVPPGQMEPIDYDKCLPPHLQEFHNLLSSQSRLENHRFRGWQPAGDNTSAHWVEYVDNIQVVELSGRFYRLMECLDEPKIIPV